VTLALEISFGLSAAWSSSLAGRLKPDFAVGRRAERSAEAYTAKTMDLKVVG
jgi:hypothetical protein